MNTPNTPQPSEAHTVNMSEHGTPNNIEIAFSATIILTTDTPLDSGVPPEQWDRVTLFFCHNAYDDHAIMPLSVEERT